MNTTKIKSIVFYVIVAIIVLTYFFIRLPALEISFFNGITAPTDFMQDYIAGKQMLAGKSVYPSNYMALFTNILSKNNIESNKTNNFAIYVNAHPPFAAMLLLPLWFFSFHNGIFLWSLITIICLLIIVLLLLRSEDISLIYFPLITLFVLAWPPFQYNLFMGQISILVSLFVIAAWYFLQRGQENKAGILIALATMLKFYPGLLIAYFLINKQHKAFISAFVSISIILILTFIINKNDFYYFYFHKLLLFDVNYPMPTQLNLSLGEFFTKLIMIIKTYDYGRQTFTCSVNFVQRNIYLYVTEFILILYLIRSIKRYDYNNVLGFSVFIILSLLLSPLCWNHYLTLLLLPLIVFIKELIKKSSTYEIIIFLIALFFISIDTMSVYFLKVLYIVHGLIPGNPESFFYRMTFYSLPFYGMVLLLFLNFRMIKKYKKAVTEKAF